MIERWWSLLPLVAVLAVLAVPWCHPPEPPADGAGDFLVGAQFIAASQAPAADSISPADPALGCWWSDEEEAAHPVAFRLLAVPRAKEAGGQGTNVLLSGQDAQWVEYGFRMTWAPYPDGRDVYLRWGDGFVGGASRATLDGDELSGRIWWHSDDRPGPSSSGRGTWQRVPCDAP